MADYKVVAGSQALPRTATTTPFNILVESLTLADFELEAVVEFFGQHTEETGQPFTRSAKVWRERRSAPLPTGLGQLERYMDQVAASHGWFMIFDRRSRSEGWREAIHVEHHSTPSGLTVVVLRS